MKRSESNRESTRAKIAAGKRNQGKLGSNLVLSATNSCHTTWTPKNASAAAAIRCNDVKE